MKKYKFYVTQGLPASGKTTWSKNFIKEQNDVDKKNHYKRIHKDDLREMLDVSIWSKENEKFILKVRNSIIADAMESGYNIISDDTNLHPKHIEAFQKMINEANEINNEWNYEMEIINFTHVSRDECIARDKLREKSVGEKVIRNMYNQFLKKKEETQCLIPYDFNKMNCIICDLDGTLAWNGDRSPYDTSRCEEDEVNPAVLKILHSLDGSTRRIFVTGRENKYLQPTKNFLDDVCKSNDYPLFDYDLYMREVRDCPDTEIKENILKEKILPYYNVLFVLEDRDRVVQMYRNNGIQCFQVKDGNY